MKLFKKDEKEIEKFFLKQPINIKKNLHYDTALKYKTILEKNSAKCKIVECDETNDEKSQNNLVQNC